MLYNSVGSANSESNSMDRKNTPETLADIVMSLNYWLARYLILIPVSIAR